MMKNGEKKSSKAGRYYFSFFQINCKMCGCLAPSAKNPSESELSMCRHVSPPCPNYSPVLFCSFKVLHSWYRLAVSRGSCNVTRPPAAHWKHMVALQEAGHILWWWLCACVCFGLKTMAIGASASTFITDARNSSCGGETRWTFGKMGLWSEAWQTWGDHTCRLIEQKLFFSLFLIIMWYSASTV